MGCCENCGVRFHWFSLALASMLVVLACVCCGAGSGTHFSFGGEKYWGGSKFKFDITTWEDYSDVTDEFISRYFSFSFQLLAIGVLISVGCSRKKSTKLVLLVIAVILIVVSGFLEGWAAVVFNKADDVFPHMVRRRLEDQKNGHEKINEINPMSVLVGLKIYPDYLVVVTWVLSAIFCSTATVFVIIAICTVKFVETAEVAPIPNEIYPPPQGTTVDMCGGYDQPPQIASA